MLEEIKAKAQSLGISHPIFVQAPGRINLIGEHTDYNNGFVLPAAIDQSIFFAVGLNSSTNQAEIHSFNYEGAFTLDVANIPSELPSSWQAYIQASLLELQAQGYELKGFQCLFGGNIAIGAGLSSSAALCCGFIYGLSELLGWQIDREKIAHIAQSVEHRIGLNCGLMDQSAVLLGQANKALLLDCQDLSYQYFPLDLGDYTLVLINSKITHELAVDSEYNDRRQACEEAVSIIAQEHPEVKSLRNVNQALLEKFKAQMPPITFQRAQYVILENQRVQSAVEALQKDDMIKMGELLYQSHQGLSQEYEVSTPEIDILVELTKNESTILGARMMGGGFGGCTLNLVAREQVEEIIPKICQQYEEQTGIKPEFYVCQVKDGVHLISE